MPTSYRYPFALMLATVLATVLAAGCGDGGGGASAGGAGGSDASPADSGLDASGGTLPPDARPVTADASVLDCDAQICDNAGHCECAPCTPGTLDCLCGEADSGEATACGEDQICGDSGTCESCVFGAEDCLCRHVEAGAACDNGLVCSPEGVCETCSNRTQGCPCIAGACGGGLTCGDDGTCRSPLGCGNAGCRVGQECQAAAGADATCLESCIAGYNPWDADLGCVATPSCEEGTPGSLVDACAGLFRQCTVERGEPGCGACIGNVAEVNGQCPDNRSPEERCGAQSRLVVDGACGACLDTHVEDLTNDTCVDRVTCRDLETLGAACNSGECVEATAARDAQCEMRLCGEGEYRLRDACVACDQCYVLSDGAPVPKPGVTGNLDAPYSNADNRCVCRLEPGYFQRAVDGDVVPCDRDGDGWTTADILAVEQEAGGNNAFNTNQTCSVRRVGRFELVSDDHPGPQARLPARIVTIGDIVTAHNLQAAAYEVDAQQNKYVRLIEPDALDFTEGLAERYEAPAELQPYGHGLGAIVARSFTPVEVNPLTKACNNDADDLNLDGLADTTQSQDAPYAAPPMVLPPATPVFYHMAYFLEANRGHYRAPVAGEAHGAYVVIEKTRNGAQGDVNRLELTYGDDTAAGWDDCARGRDSAYDPMPSPLEAAPVGFDFARWHVCAATSAAGEAPGHCLAANDRHQYGRYVAYDGRARRTALAGLAQPDADGQWPGMNHHGQFKCMKLVGDDAAPPESGTVGASQIRQRGPGADPGDPPGALLNPETAQYTLQHCLLNPPGLDGRDVDAALGDLIRNPGDPLLDCYAVDLASDVTDLFAERANNRREDLRSYWVSWNTPDQAQPTLNADSADRHVRGCINEALEWPFLCAGYDANPLRTRAFPIASASPIGQLLCGCGVERSGTECEEGCVGDHLFTGGDFAGAPGCDAESGFCPAAAPDDDADPPFAGGQRGYWMCARSAASVGDPGDEALGTPQSIVLIGIADAEIVDVDNRPVAAVGSELMLVGHVPAVAIERGDGMISTQNLPGEPAGTPSHVLELH